MKEGRPDKLHDSSYWDDMQMMHRHGDGDRKQELEQKKGGRRVEKDDRARSRWNRRSRVKDQRRNRRSGCRHVRGVNVTI